MGSVAKAVKKVTKAVKKPLSKITKGIAKGIMVAGKRGGGVQRMGGDLPPFQEAFPGGFSLLSLFASF